MILKRIIYCLFIVIWGIIMTCSILLTYILILPYMLIFYIIKGYQYDWIENGFIVVYIEKLPGKVKKLLKI
jgi:hypothetical protein